jgi:sensor histidine kinase regulating citrate/malate metabolism
MVVNPIPLYINERQSDLQGVKEGWYAIDDHGRLLSGPFPNQEICLTRIGQSGTD